MARWTRPMLSIPLVVAVCAGFAAEAPARVALTSARHGVSGDGSILSEGRVVRQHGEARVPIVQRDEIALRGDHNVDNVLSAVALAAELGVSDASIADADGRRAQFRTKRSGRAVLCGPGCFRPGTTRPG